MNGLGILQLKTTVLTISKSDITHPKVMVPPESLSHYLSNEYHNVWGFNRVIK
jgi:hypothetical protein